MPQEHILGMPDRKPFYARVSAAGLTSIVEKSLTITAVTTSALKKTLMQKTTIPYLM